MSKSGSERSQNTIRVPRSLIALTAISLVLPAFAYWFREWLSDGWLHFDFAIANITTGLCWSVLALVWLSWLVRNTTLHRPLAVGIVSICLAIPIVGLLLYRPVFRGGISVDRWEPRWWTKPIVKNGSVSSSPGKRSSMTSDPDAFWQFLGPNRNGVVSLSGGNLSHCSTWKSIWKIPIGSGWSGFVASNDLCFTMQQVGDKESVVCFDIRSGEQVWEFAYNRRHDELLGGVGPRSTPTLELDRLYCQGANGLFTCLNANDGSLIWQADLSALLSIPLVERTNTQGLKYQVEQFPFDWGRSGSPLVFEELVIVCGGGNAPHCRTLIAFDKKDGQVKWMGGEFSIGYSSPVLMELCGEKQIVSVNEKTVCGISPSDGRVLWSFAQPGSSQLDANTSQPVQIAENRILTSKGYGFGGMLTEVSRSDGVWTTETIWKNAKILKTKMTSPVIKDGFAYALSDGILECIEVQTGNRQWKSGRFGHGQLLLVGDWLLVHAETGGLTVVRANPAAYEPLGSINTIDGVCWNTLCLYKNHLLLRSDLEAICIDID